MLGMVLPTVGWALLHQLATKKMSPQTRPQASLLPSPQKTPDLCQVDSGSDYDRLKVVLGFVGVLKFILCVCVFCLHDYMFTTCEPGACRGQKSRRGCWIPGTGHQVVMSHLVGAGTEPVPQQEQQVLPSHLSSHPIFIVSFFFLVLLPFHWASFFFFFFLFFLFLRQGLTV